MLNTIKDACITLLIYFSFKQLYSVGSDGTPKYIQNTWTGSYALQTSASISDDIPANTAAGLYYYR